MYQMALPARMLSLIELGQPLPPPHSPAFRRLFLPKMANHQCLVARVSQGSGWFLEAQVTGTPEPVPVTALPMFNVESFDANVPNPPCPVTVSAVFTLPLAGVLVGVL
jgi:hypothetical protein